jgi:excisionase family DNA binding protein
VTPTLDFLGPIMAAVETRVDERVNERLQELRQSLWMTVAEAAQYLRVGTSRIYKLTAADEIPHCKQDGRLYFDREELDAWMREHRRGPSVEVPQQAVEAVDLAAVAELFESIVSTPALGEGA